MWRKSLLRRAGIVTFLFATGLDSTGAQVRPAIEMEVVTLTPKGFSPDSLVRPRGPFRLLIQNTTRTKNVPIDFVDDKSVKVKDLGLDERGGKRKSELIDLPPGTYTVRVPSQGRWTLRIEIR